MLTKSLKILAVLDVLFLSASVGLVGLSQGITNPTPEWWGIVMNVANFAFYAMVGLNMFTIAISLICDELFSSESSISKNHIPAKLRGKTEQA